MMSRRRAWTGSGRGDAADATSARQRRRVDEDVGMRIGETDGRSGSSTGSGLTIRWRGFVDDAVVFGEEQTRDPLMEQIRVGKRDAASDVRKLFAHFDRIQTEEMEKSVKIKVGQGYDS